MKLTKLTKKKIFSRENIGLLLALLACIIFWLPIYKYSETRGILFWKKFSQKVLDLKPGLISGLAALIVTFVLYIRGIISFNNKLSKLLSFLVNLTLFATIIEIFISPSSVSATSNPFLKSTSAFIISIACGAVIFFGLREIAKVVLLGFLVFIFYFNIKLVNDAMGFLGYINLVLIILSFSFQQNISINQLGMEFKYLFGNIKSTKTIISDKNTDNSFLEHASRIREEEKNL